MVVPIALVLFVLIAPAVAFGHHDEKISDAEMSLEIAKEIAAVNETPIYVFYPGINTNFLMGVPHGNRDVRFVEVMRSGWVRIYVDDEFARTARAVVCVNAKPIKSVLQQFNGTRGTYLGVKIPKQKEGRHGYDMFNIIVSVYGGYQLNWQGQMIIDRPSNFFYFAPGDQVFSFDS